MAFPFYYQLDSMDCGATCLRMIARFYGKTLDIEQIRKQSYINKLGASLLGLSKAAETYGFQTLAIRTTLDKMLEENTVPFIAHWKQNHFLVVYKITEKKVYVADPAQGKITYPRDEFEKYWAVEKGMGIVLLLQPTTEFYYENEDIEEKKPHFNRYSHLIKYIYPYKSLVWQLGYGFVAISILSLITPFLTQALVDTGIEKQNLSFIYVILGAQLMFFVGRTVLWAIRGWLLLHISSRINISLSSDFLRKMMRLPIPFFDSKNLGDILQRIQDNQRIQGFLTSSSLDFLFSLFTLIIVSNILLVYNTLVFVMFFGGSTLYIIWVIIFLRQRKQLDARRFAQMAANQGNEVQLVQGMTELKLYNAESIKRYEWERIQIKLFKLSVKGLTLAQIQQVGGSFINELKNILITIWCATEVIEGKMTLGMMMATQQILGQLDAPVLQFVGFMQQAQDAQLSLERLAEIHSKSNEDENINNAEILKEIPDGQDIVFNEVSFRYGNPQSDWILENVSFSLSFGQTLAIVGESGSGKTTILKLLLKFYEPETGEIYYGNTPLRKIDTTVWRNKIGTVMQDGFIFSDSIADNIGLGAEQIDNKRLIEASEIANAKTFIQNLPLAYETKIGSEGLGLSQGQKQRILIARAVYKNPNFLFFDEATSALDATNEKQITENLTKFSENRSILVIAHRLSTVKNANQIIVLKKGKIVESGTHIELTIRRGLYYELVKNQLELGN